MRLGKYELLSELASGGMGTVHVARQIGAAGFSRLVAIKRLHPHLLKQPQFRTMVRDEALLASQIHHPNVVPVVDLIEQDSELCLVLEYVPSLPLSALMRAAASAGETLPPAVVSRIVADVLAGLHAAHEVRGLDGQALGIVHRDVSPQNVLVAVDGSARLIDFGIAKATVTNALTKSGELKGKLPYMSPEQLRREPVDRRADIFAAGAMTYEALTGTRRFKGSDEGAILLSILLGGPSDLSSQGFPLDVDRMVNTALATKEERFGDARAFQDALEHAIPPAPYREVAETLERLCGQRLAERTERIRGMARAEGTPLASSADIEPTTIPLPGSKSKRVRWFAVPATAIALVIGLGWYVRHASAGDQRASAEPPTTFGLQPAAPPPAAVDVTPTTVGQTAAQPTSSAVQRATPADAGVRALRPAARGVELKKNPFH